MQAKETIPTSVPLKSNQDFFYNSPLHLLESSSGFENLPKKIPNRSLGSRPPGTILSNMISDFQPQKNR